jgi:hypothetical protein
VPADITGAHLSGVLHRLTREERRELAREILARLDARRAAEQLRQAPQLELFSPDPDYPRDEPSGEA